MHNWSRSTADHVNAAESFARGNCSKEPVTSRQNPAASVRYLYIPSLCHVENSRRYIGGKIKVDIGRGLRLSSFFLLFAVACVRVGPGTVSQEIKVARA